jgi:serine phosphatase RsbU (regulator of sigma subunit)
MSKADLILEIILGAIRRETEAFRYYTDASKQSPYSQTTALLRQLAEEERKHRRILVREFASLKGLLAADPSVPDASSLEGDHVQYHLPAELPFESMRTVPRVDMAAVSLPTHFIGGDYVESYPLRPSRGADGQLGLLLSDVMGHGMEAISLKAEARRILGQIEDDDETQLSRPDKLVESLNRRLYAPCQKSAGFVTLCYVVMDPQEGKMCYVSAGHELPVVIDPGKGCERALGGGQLLIGLDEDHRYTLEKASLEPGDIVVLFSDGILESLNDREEEFGRQRLVESLIEGRNEDARSIVRRVFKTLGAFVKKQAFTDEITLAVARFIEDQA